ncbi:carbohydrate ABC transporter permease [Paenibacillus flagellatus]|uniref:ABC transporter permease n=1 Tax=Paenibacillus flagellatus TaxID=2211139 RepID=A0A2V5KKU4_9BACL|nr:carbohydrate ABC transporter permease [Paenibacillus flagellatus]PYI51287.1 ABC transporter permease [Paenibacillus flagellatus]
MTERRRRRRTGLAELGLWALSAFILVPYLMVVLTSLKSSKEAGLFRLELPSEIHLWDNYRVVFERGLVLQGFTNSMLVTAGSVVTVLLCSALLSFYIARMRGRISEALYRFFLLGMVAPISLVTTFDVLKTFKLLNTRTGIVMIFAGILIPFATFIYVGFVRTIPRELDEAATIDGCGPYRLFAVIIFPLMKPITFTAGILVFMNVWNDSQIPLFFLNDNRYWTMPLNIYRFYGYFSKDWNYIFGNILLTTLPVLLLYLLGQRFMIEGMTSGAVKG